MPTSESPQRMAWSRNSNGLSLAIVSSHSDNFAISTASGFLSTPYRHRWAIDAAGEDQPLVRSAGRSRSCNRPSDGSP